MIVADFISGILEISLVMSVLIAVLLALSPLLAKKYTARSLCIVWLVVALRLLVPVNANLIQPVIAIRVPVLINAGTAPADNTADNLGQAVTPDMTTQPVNSSAANAEKSNGPPVSTVAALLWALGALVFILVRLSGYLLLRRQIRRFSKPLVSIQAAGTFDLLLKKMHISDGILKVRVFPMARSPMMTGFFHPVILLPDIEYQDAEELELILRHEMVHYKRRDIWFKLLIACGNAVHWFNPLAYMMAREADRQIENACDQEIVRGGDLQLRRKYGESILAAMTRDHIKRPGLSTYFHGGKKTMKQRFKNIFDLKIKKRGTSIVIAAFLVMMISSTLVACRANAPGTGNSPPATESPAATDTVSVTDPAPTASASGTTDGRDSIETIASDWAAAVKNRDGKAQYALMTKALQEKMYDEFAGLNWVTGTSSPWVESYAVKVTDSGAEVLFAFATSTGPAGSYRQSLTFKEEAGSLKIDSISELQEVISASAPPSPSSSIDFKDLIGLIGMTKEALLKALPEEPVTVDEGGLGFDQTGIRIWFDTATYTKVAQVLILSDTIDIDGLTLGDSYQDFKARFGDPISDTNGDAHFKYGEVYLSVVRDTATDKTIAVYILAENF